MASAMCAHRPERVPGARACAFADGRYVLAGEAANYDVSLLRKAVHHFPNIALMNM